MSIDSIPVRVELPPPDGLTGNALPLLIEIASQLEKLLATAQPHSIDLGALPLSEADKIWLKSQLGEGEIHSTLQAQGPSSIDETGCPGVWWISHRDEAGHVQSEFIEICHVPEILKAHPNDVQSGYETLKNRISDLS